MKAAVIAVMLGSMSLSTWPTEAEAAEQLGCDLRTIQRYGERGRIEIRKRPRDGKKPENVCNPRDVQQLMPTAHVIPDEPESAPPANRAGELTGPIEIGTNTHSHSSNGMGELLAFITAITAVVNQQQQLALPPPTPPVPSRWMSIEEAAAENRFAESFLRAQIKAGKIIGLPAGPRGRVLVLRTSVEEFKG